MPVDIIDEIRSIEHKADRMTLREKIFVAAGIVCFIFLLGLGVAWSTKAYAAPIYRASEGNVTITLSDEACQLPVVQNLQKRAVWTENGKDIEGCWGAHPAFPVVMFYFADKSVVIVPQQAFEPVVGV